MKQKSSMVNRLPFSVTQPPPKHPVLGIALLLASRLVMLFGYAGKCALLGFLGIMILYALISSGAIHPTYEEGSRPFTTREFVVFAASALAIGVIGFLIDPLGKKMLYLGRKLRSTDAVKMLSDDPRSPVLFLRSFKDDQIDDPTMTGIMEWKRQRYEERLTHALGKIGPVVCIGRPGESYSEAGAARLYVDDEHWQDAILFLMQESSVVVIVVGDTVSLQWEIETAVSSVSCSKILFFFPYVEPTKIERTSWQRLRQKFFPMNVPKPVYLQMEEERQRRYLTFCDRFGSRFKSNFPDKLADEQFLNFSPEGKALLIKTRRHFFSSFATLLDRSFKMHINVPKTLRPFISMHA